MHCRYYFKNILLKTIAIAIIISFCSCKSSTFNNVGIFKYNRINLKNYFVYKFKTRLIPVGLKMAINLKKDGSFDLIQCDNKIHESGTYKFLNDSIEFNFYKADTLFKNVKMFYENNEIFLPFYTSKVKSSKRPFNSITILEKVDSLVSFETCLN